MGMCVGVLYVRMCVGIVTSVIGVWGSVAGVYLGGPSIIFIMISGAGVRVRVWVPAAIISCVGVVDQGLGWPLVHLWVCVGVRVGTLYLLLWTWTDGSMSRV